METLEGEREGLEKEAVIIIRERINAKLEVVGKDEDNGKVIVGIVGGTSVPKIFKLLEKEKEIPWNKVHIFMLDERKVPLDNELSNFKMAKELFLDVLPEKNVHPFNFEKHTLQDYEEEMKTVVNFGEELPFFDIIIISSGENGHIASLFPNHESIKKDSDMFIKVDDAPIAPPERMSASRRLIGRSKTAILLFFGKNKAKAYKKFIINDGEIEKCPAKLIKSIKESYILVDKELLEELNIHY